MPDLVTRVLTRYTADTRDHKKKLRELKGEEKERHKQLIENLEAQNKKIDGQIATWGKWVVGIGSAIAAFKALDAGFETYERNARLRAANVGTDLEGLQKATRGLVDDTRLLEFSAQAMNGTFALTQRETESVLKGALALRKTLGVDLAEAMDRVQQAVNEANGEALKPLGITIKETTGTAEAQQAIIKALAGEYDSLGGKVGLATDEVTRSRTSFANSIDSIKESLGKIAVALAPVVELIGAAAEKVSDIVNLIVGDNSPVSRSDQLAAFRRRETKIQSDLSSISDRDPLIRSRQEEELRKVQQAIRGLERQIVNDSFTGPRLGGDLVGRGRDFANRAFAQLSEGLKQEARKSRGRRATSGGFSLDAAVVDEVSQTAIAEGFFAAGGSLQSDGFRSIDQFSQQQQFSTDSLRSNADEVQQILAGMQDDFAMFDEAKAAALQSETDVATRIFGPVDVVTTNLDIMGSAFDGFSSIAQAGFEAFISGSEGVGTAVKKMTGQVLRSMAVEMAIKALRATAQGIWYSVTSPGQAAGAFAAAGKFALGAAAAGAAASAFGAGGATTPTGGAAPAVSGLGGGGGAASTGQTTVFLLGEGFTDRPARERVADFRRSSRRAGLTFAGDVVERV